MMLCMSNFVCAEICYKQLVLHHIVMLKKRTDQTDV